MIILLINNLNIYKNLVGFYENIKLLLISVTTFRRGKKEMLSNVEYNRISIFICFAAFVRCKKDFLS